MLAKTSLPQAGKTVRQRLEGTWKLVIFQRLLPTGEWVDYWGEKVEGQLIYTADGYLSVQQMQPGRSVFAADAKVFGTTQEIVEAFKGYVAYSGRYEVDEEAGIVTHIVECSLFPNWVGQRLERVYQFSDIYLTLVTAPVRGSSQARLIWQRLSGISSNGY